MAGLRSAPAVNGTPSSIQVSLHWIDHTGEKRSDSVICDPAVTPAQIEAYANAAQAMSNASLYKVSVTDLYAGSAQSSNAVEAVYEDVGSSAVFQFKDPVQNISRRGYIPSFMEAFLNAGTETVDTTTTEFNTYITAVNAILPAAFEAIGVRFTQRRDINEQVSI